MSIAMPSVGWIGPWIALACTIALPRLVAEQVDGVRGVVPQQVVGPAARLAERVHVRAAEEVGLHVHLLDVELAGHDALVHPLVARVEAARVAAHATSPVCFCELGRRPRASVELSASGISTCTCLPAFRHAIVCAACICVGVHRMTASTPGRARLRRGRWWRAAMPYLLRDLLRRRRARGRPARPLRRRRSVLMRVEVLDAERAGAGERDFDRVCRSLAGSPGSDGPTAVLDAGT